MRYRHFDAEPDIHPDAVVAPSAVIAGGVHIGPGARVLHAAVLTADGGRVEIGPDCVIMENAVLRGTAQRPLTLGPECLVGPHAHLSGCTIERSVLTADGGRGVQRCRDRRGQRGPHRRYGACRLASAAGLDDPDRVGRRRRSRRAAAAGSA